MRFENLLAGLRTDCVRHPYTRGAVPANCRLAARVPVVIKHFRATNVRGWDFGIVPVMQLKRTPVEYAMLEVLGCPNAMGVETFGAFLRAVYPNATLDYSWEFELGFKQVTDIDPTRRFTEQTSTMFSRAGWEALSQRTDYDITEVLNLGWPEVKRIFEQQKSSCVWMPL